MKTKNKKAISMRIAAIMTISVFTVLLMAIPGVMGDPGTTYYVSTTGQEASVTCANPESVTAGTYWWTLINNGYSLSDGNTLTMKVEGGAEQTVTFNTAEFSDITKAKASEIAAVINSETTGLTAYVSPPGDQCSGEPNPKKVSIRSDNPSGSIQVTGGTANAADKLDFDTAVHSGSAGTSASPWRTIQYAVIMASPGDTIQVAAGTYYEAVNIVGKDHITVAGVDRDTTTIDGSGQHVSQSGSSDITYEIDGPTSPIFIQNSEYVTIQGFTLKKSEGWGVIYMNNADHCTITDNIVKRDCWMFSGSSDYQDYDPDARVHPGYGIYLFKNNEYNMISNNIVHGASASETYGYESLDHADRGIFLYKFSGNPIDDQNDGNEISNNEVYNFRVNIRVCRADDNVITGNCIHQARDNSWGWNGAGIQILSYNDPNSPTRNNKVYYNTIVCSDVGDGNALDTGQNTAWDDGISRGNYWDDYTGVDANGDGIGDTPYGPIHTANTFDNYPVHPLPMSEFQIDHAKIDFKKKPDDDKVRVQGKLELDLVNGDGVDISEPVTVTVDSLSETIGMVEKGKEGEKWEYMRPKGGTGNIKHMTINWKNGNFDVRMDKADLSGMTNPVTIGIQIGDDLGKETITMTEKKHHWDYKA